MLGEEIGHSLCPLPLADLCRRQFSAHMEWWICGRRHLSGGNIETAGRILSAVTSRAMPSKKINEENTNKQPTQVLSYWSNLYVIFINFLHESVTVPTKKKNQSIIG